MSLALRRAVFVLGLAVFVAGMLALGGIHANHLPQSTALPDAAQRQLLSAWEASFPPGRGTATPRPAAQPVPVRDRPAAQPVPVGHGLVQLRIPRFGSDWRWLALEGTTQRVLANGPGHYRGTPLPGARGNVAFAAHRSGQVAPFLNFERLRPGDRVIFRQGTSRWVYAIDTPPRVIDIDDDWVLDPLPGRRLTLTTCWPKYGSSHRVYVRASLV